MALDGLEDGRDGNVVDGELGAASGQLLGDDAAASSA